MDIRSKLPKLILNVRKDNKQEKVKMKVIGTESIIYPQLLISCLNKRRSVYIPKKEEYSKKKLIYIPTVSALENSIEIENLPPVYTYSEPPCDNTLPRNEKPSSMRRSLISLRSNIKHSEPNRRAMSNRQSRILKHWHNRPLLSHEISLLKVHPTKNHKASSVICWEYKENTKRVKRGSITRKNSLKVTLLSKRMKFQNARLSKSIKKQI